MYKYKHQIRRLIGSKVSFKRIAGNSIIIYFNGNPGDLNIKSIWVDPAWRYEKNGKYIVGSGDFPWEKERNESEKDFNRRFNSICNKTNPIIGTAIIDIFFDKITNDICIKFEKNQIIKNFNSSFNSESWVYRDRKIKYCILGYQNKIKRRKET